MVLALIKALYNDGRRDSAGIATDVAGQPAE